MGELKDGGKRETYNTGAIREPATGKGAYELMSPFALMRIAKHYENGDRKYPDPPRNWELGIKFSRLIQSATRHLNQWEQGDRSEDHLSAICWNVMAMIHFEEVGMDKELNDYPFYPAKEAKSAPTKVYKEEKLNIKDLSGDPSPFDFSQFKPAPRIGNYPLTRQQIWELPLGTEVWVESASVYFDSGVFSVDNVSFTLGDFQLKSMDKNSLCWPCPSDSKLGKNYVVWRYQKEPTEQEKTWYARRFEMAAKSRVTLQNRPLSSDEIKQLPVGAKVWVEDAGNCSTTGYIYCPSGVYCLRAATSPVTNVYLRKDSEESCPVRECHPCSPCSGLGKDYAVWLLPQEPTEDEKRAHPDRFVK